MFNKSVFLVVILFIYPTFVEASGIGVTPKSIEVSQSANSNTEQIITIFNTGQKIAEYQVFPDQWSQLIIVSPDNFILEPDGNKQITVAFNDLPMGNYQSNLSIVSHDTENDVFKTGVKIPMEFNIIAEKTKSFSYLILGAFLFLVLAGIFVLLWLVRHKNITFLKRSTDSINYQKLSISILKTKKRLWFYGISIILVILVLLMLVADILGGGRKAIISQNNQSGGIQANLMYADTFYSQDLPWQEEITPFSVLQQIVDNNNYSLNYEYYESMGVLVTEINGVKNGEQGKYWLYFINNEIGQMAADKYLLNPGDKLEWKFVAPQ